MTLAGSLSGLQQLAEKATPGPWGTDGDEFSHGVRPYNEAHPIIASWDNRWAHHEQALTNAAFIAAADPGMVAALVEVAKAAKHARSLHGRFLGLPILSEGNLDEFVVALDALDAALARLEAVLAAPTSEKGTP